MSSAKNKRQRGLKLAAREGVGVCVRAAALLAWGTPKLRTPYGLGCLGDLLSSCAGMGFFPPVVIFAPYPELSHEGSPWV